MYLVFDTETTGFVKKAEPDSSPDQPYLVEIAGLLIQPDFSSIDETMNEIIDPGVPIPDHVAKIHGIDDARAQNEGIPLADALAKFLPLWEAATIVVTHNTAFDLRIMQIACYRAGIPLPDRPDFCTMNAMRDLGLKKYNLAASYEYFFAKPPKHLHNALSDSKACAAVLHQLMTKQLATL